MRTLVVDALRLVGPRTAMGRYLEYMAEEWSRMELPFERVVLMAPGEPELRLPGGAGVSLRRLGGREPRLWWEQVTLPRAARHAALLFGPAYVCPLAYAGRRVVANHGIYEGLPGEFGAFQRLRTIPLYRRSAHAAQRVIANSEATRADLVRHFGLDRARIDVVLPAAHELFHRPQDPRLVEAEVSAALGARLPYVLFVGKLSRRRHAPALIEAFARARRGGTLPHRLLFVGPNVDGLPLDALAERFGVSGQVRHVPHLDQPRLARLYAGADVYALPTTHEGLSWTILEAMASGAPVLTVEHRTLAEVGAGAVHALPSASVDHLAAGLSRLLHDPQLRERLARLGRAEARRLSWRRSAAQTMAILDAAALPADRGPV